MDVVRLYNQWVEVRCLYLHLSASRHDIHAIKNCTGTLPCGLTRSMNSLFRRAVCRVLPSVQTRHWFTGIWAGGSAVNGPAESGDIWLRDIDQSICQKVRLMIQNVDVRFRRLTADPAKVLKSLKHPETKNASVLCHEQREDVPLGISTGYMRHMMFRSPTNLQCTFRIVLRVMDCVS